MSTHFDLLVIGFGKGGKTLAVTLANQGKKVALVEQSADMYGGTCINIGCVPTKALAHRAQEVSHIKSAADLEAAFEGAVAFRGSLTEKLRAANFSMLNDLPSATVITGHARFTSDTQVEVSAGGETLVLTAETIVINTGAVPVLPPIKGLAESSRVLTSTEAQQLPGRPASLAVIGGGPIGIEFASIFAQFGTRVTLINDKPALFDRYDADVAATATGLLEDAGIKPLNGMTVTEIQDAETRVKVLAEDSQGQQLEVESDYVLVATGRKPATENLGLENTTIKTTDRGAIVVDEYLRTSVPGIFAIGDVNGGPQFTYISLDDFRIVLDQLTGNGKRSTKDRVAVPNTIFTNPPLASVGMTAAAAEEAGKNIRTATQTVASIKAMPRPKILGNPAGIMKFVIDAETDQILGAQLLSVDAQELINLVALAMRTGTTATELKNGIYTHPSSTEALNEVLGQKE
ncbi:MAG: FAD-dependent oxidoreductase [Rothia sp. (in: high G+C Gram-positive bacteria)]|nr:FAD-dependent oxidoreductase [Rothia sp. (in: high G+C Gram-positive bacteria)]